MFVAYHQQYLFIFLFLLSCRDLESTISDLREALQKRFPDSISNLLYATSAAGLGADPAELAAAQQEAGQLREMLEDNAKAFERKNLGLRQEFERIRVAYEDRIRQMEQTHSSAPDEYESGAAAPFSRSKVSASASAVARRAATFALEPEGKPWSGNKLNPAKNLSQALARIKELEVGEGRLRAFYTRKIEDLQRRYELQIHALKRTGSLPADASGGGGHGGRSHHPYAMPHGTGHRATSGGGPGVGAGARAADDNTLDSEENDTSMNSNSNNTASTGDYDNMKGCLDDAEKRTSLLQGELLRTAEELGRARKTITALEEALKQSGRGEPSLLVVGETGHSPGGSSISGGDDKHIKIIQLQQQVSMLQQQVQDYRNISLTGALPGNIGHSPDELKQKDAKIVDLEQRTHSLQQRLDETVGALHKETLGQAEARADWAETQKRLIEKIESVQNESMNQRDQMRALQATPEMHNFLV
jgi:hypothetical protein